MPKGSFKIQNMSDTKVSININGVIGDWGNTSQDVIEQIEMQDVQDIDVYIQSPGGNAFEGIAIHNALRMHPANVTTYVLGAAASAGSIIFMAGNTRIMPSNTYLMIHEPALGIYGKAKELREAADFLENMTTALVATYAPHVKITEAEVLDLVMAETWMKAEQAESMGFATQIDQQIEVAALSQEFIDKFDKLPQALSQKSISDVVNNITNIKEFETALRESGCSKALATAMASKAKDLILSESECESEAIYTILNNFKL